MSSSSSTALDVVYMHMDNFEIRTTHNEEVTSTGWSCGCRTLNITHNAKLWGQKLEIKVSNLSTCVIERERDREAEFDGAQFCGENGILDDPC